jgi:hypothetical protein
MKGAPCGGTSKTRELHFEKKKCHEQRQEGGAVHKVQSTWWYACERHQIIMANDSVEQLTCWFDF